MKGQPPTGDTLQPHRPHGESTTIAAPPHREPMATAANLRHNRVVQPPPFLQAKHLRESGVKPYEVP